MSANGSALKVLQSGQIALVEMEPAGDLPSRKIRGHTLYTVVSQGTELASGFLGKNFPAGLGYAAVFEVDEVGAEVTDWKPGDRAFCMGPHRSRQEVSASDAVPLPKDLPGEHGPFARLMGVSMSTLITTRARPGDRVVVTGLGPVGYLAAHAFARGGYRVLGVEPNPERLAAAKASGLTVLGAVPEKEEDSAKAVSLVVECSGHEQAVLDAAKLVRKGGEVVLVGVPWAKRTEITSFDLLHAVFHNYVYLRSGWEWELDRHQQEFRTGSIYQNFRTAMDWLAQGAIPLAGQYAIESPRDAQKVYTEMAENCRKPLFTVFDWSEIA